MDKFDVNLDANVRKRLFFGKVCEAQKGGDCQECAKASDLFRQSRAQSDQGKKKELEDQARGLYAKSRIFINAINVRDEDKTYPVRIYAIPPLVYDEVISVIRGARQLDPQKNVFHPLTGHNILITKRGSGILTRYSTQLDQNPSKIPNEELLAQLQGGDRSGLHNLNMVEEFINDNYLHITTLNNDQNLIRLLPPFEDQTIYKEIKFHRFTIGSYRSISDGNSGSRVPDPKESGHSLDGPSFDDQGMQDEFDPSALEDIQEFTPDTNPAQAEPVPVKTEALPQTSNDSVVNALKEEIKKIEAGAGKEETERILERLKEIKSEAIGST